MPILGSITLILFEKSHETSQLCRSAQVIAANKNKKSYFCELLPLDVLLQCFMSAVCCLRFFFVFANNLNTIQLNTS